MNEPKTQQPAEGWLEELIDRLNDISVSQIPVANFAVVDALDKITDELRERLAVAAGDSAKAPIAPQTAFDSSTWLGVDLIRAERERQIAAEGWGPEHDDAHTDGALAKAAASYALHAAGVGTSYGEQNPNKGYGIMRHKNGCLLWWPWLIEWWKPKDPVRDLVRAGALVAAEIDRLNRERRKTPNQLNPMKNIQAFRKSIAESEKIAFELVAFIRKAQQQACGDGVIYKLAEQRSFDLLQKSLALRDEIVRFKSALEP